MWAGSESNIPVGAMSLSMGSAPCLPGGLWAGPRVGPDRCACMCTGPKSPLPLALGARVGVPTGEDIPGGVPGASASSEMAAADSLLLSEAMGWLEGGDIGLESAGRAAPVTCKSNVFTLRP